MELPILYRDEHYIAIHKPPHWLVHRSPISGDTVFVLQSLRDQIGQRIYPIHRLDRATSGVLIFGLSGPAAHGLVQQFEARRVVKEYWALARGWVDEVGTIDHPISDEEGNARSQPAVTRYRCLARVELAEAVDRYPSARYSLVCVTPETGRRQQIRKHFKHISHHLIGDVKHGNGKHNRFFRERYQIHRLMLLARSLRFYHPFDHKERVITAAPEAEWHRLAAAFSWSLLMDPDLSQGRGDQPGGDGDHA